MLIAGLQKMTLLDFPGRVACTVFLGGCNFRCPFCHNSQLLSAPEAVMQEQELLAFLQKRKGLLDGVCVTGGEPTLQPGLPKFLEAIRAMGYQVKLDTNGYRPDVLRGLIDAGLVDYVAMDIKNGPEHYAPTCGLERMDLKKIEESVSVLLEGRVDYELRTTVVRPIHDAQSIAAMAKWVKNLSETPVKRWFLQPFVDRETVVFAGFSAPEKEELCRFAQLLSAAAEQVSVRGSDE